MEALRHSAATHLRDVADVLASRILPGGLTPPQIESDPPLDLSVAAAHASTPRSLANGVTERFAAAEAAQCAAADAQQLACTRMSSPPPAPLHLTPFASAPYPAAAAVVASYFSQVRILPLPPPPPDHHANPAPHASPPPHAPSPPNAPAPTPSPYTHSLHPLPTPIPLHPPPYIPPPPQMLPAVLRELPDWTPTARVRASHTLLALIWHAGQFCHPFPAATHTHTILTL